MSSRACSHFAGQASSRIQRVLRVMPDQETPQPIGTLTNLPLQRLRRIRACRQPRDLLHRVKLVEDFLYMFGIIGIPAVQTRVTRQVDAPYCYTLSLEHFW